MSVVKKEGEFAMPSSKKNTVSLVTSLVGPIAEELGLDIWDVRYEKEGPVWYLRIFIDKPGGVTIDDCEAVSRRLSPVLDEADPIEHSYTLEVSSPGIERDLRKPRHFEAFLGRDVHVRLIRAADGRRDFIGRLESFKDGVITVLLDDDLEMNVSLDETAYVRLYEELDLGGID